MKIYGSDSTHLTLSAKAQKYYDETDPFKIVEHADRDDSGEPVYTYDLTDADGTVKGLSEAQLNATLEELQAVMESAESEEEEA